MRSERILHADTNVIAPAMHNSLVLRIIKCICDYMQSHSHEEVDRMLPVWGEIFADFYSRIIRACAAPRNSHRFPSASFKTLFAFLGFLTQTNVDEVAQWCLSQVDILPVRCCVIVLNHVALGDLEDGSHTLELYAHVLDRLKLG